MVTNGGTKSVAVPRLTMESRVLGRVRRSEAAITNSEAFISQT